MGRPRKRRRDGEADEHDVQPTDVDDSLIGTDEISTPGNFGMVTPPQYNDTIYPVVPAAMENELGLRQDSTESNTHGISPALGME
jgi:hypothetical protein